MHKISVVFIADAVPIYGLYSIQEQHDTWYRIPLAPVPLALKNEWVTDLLKLSWL